MFLQVCLMAAGLHAGRALIKSWLEPADGDPAAARQPPAPAGTSEPADGTPRSDAAVDEQFAVALTSAGVTTAASVLAPPLRYLGGVGVLYGSLPLFQRTAQQVLSEGHLGIEVLDTLSVVASLAARQFGISSMLFLLYAAVQKLRVRAEHTARRVLREALELPHEAWLLRDGAEVSVPVDALRPGDVVAVRAGGVVPANGEVLAGAALIDHHVLTGDPLQVPTAVGDQVPGLALVVSGAIQVRLRAAVTSVARVKLPIIMRRTAEFADTIEREAEEVADASVLPILALGALTSQTLRRYRKTLALLNVDILENLPLIAPISLLNHLCQAYEQGILIKDARALQRLLQVDTVVFGAAALRMLSAAPAVLLALRERGLALYLLAPGPDGGGGPDPRAPIAPLVPLFDRLLTGAGPEDQARIIKDLQREGRTVCYVGGGLSDAGALKQAAVSISLLGAPALVIEGVQIVFRTAGPGPAPDLCTLFALADRFQRGQQYLRLTATVPTAVAIGGILGCGFTTDSVVALYVASLAAGLAIATWAPVWTERATNALDAAAGELENKTSTRRN